MSDHDPADVPSRPLTPPAPDPAPDPVPAPDGRTPWRERVLGWRGIAAVAAAGIVLGGLGGAAIGAVVGDDGRPGPDGQHGFDGPRPDHGGPMMGGPLPPATPPQGEGVAPGGLSS